MNLYTCMIDLKHDAKALQFAAALDCWLTHLRAQGVIGKWRLMRRKLNLAADGYRDFVVEIEVDDLAQLDRAFHATANGGDEAAALHARVHDMIEHADYALFRPFPDPQGAERAALI